MGLDMLVACLITLPPAFASSDKHLPPPACDLRGGSIIPLVFRLYTIYVLRIISIARTAVSDNLC